MTEQITTNTILSHLELKNITIPEIELKGLCSTEDIKENHITFFKGKSINLLESKIRNFKNVVVLVPSNFELPDSSKNIFIPAENPHKSFIDCIPLFFIPKLKHFGIHPSSCVDPTVKIGEKSHVGPFSYIGANVIIGENTFIYPNVTIYDNVQIGDNCIIHSGATIREDVVIGNNIVIQNGAIIGADGFGYIPDPKMGLIPVPQIGNVVLADYVDIGANACVDRAAIGATNVGRGTKIDNLVQIGHNTQIGSFTIICGQAAIAGSTKIGNQVVLGGNVGIADHTEIADGCRFAGFSGIHGKFTERGDYAGNPAIPVKLHRRIVASLSRLPKIVAQNSKK